MRHFDGKQIMCINGFRWLRNPKNEQKVRTAVSMALNKEGVKG